MEVKRMSRRQLLPDWPLRQYNESALYHSSRVPYGEHSQYHQLPGSLYHQQSSQAFDSYQISIPSGANPINMSLALLSMPNHVADDTTTDPTTYNDYANMKSVQSEGFEQTANTPFDDVFTYLQQGQHEEYQAMTLEPRMMLRQYEPNTYINIESQPQLTDLYNDCGYEYPGPNILSALDASNAYQEVCQWPASPSLSDATLSSSLCKHVSEDDEIMDKPYARLIYEALMQIPGHRMMLQELYEWFLQNTTKPRESGSNGWQNSIRHNLSMNKAFENDKSTISGSRGQSRKANSVWMLTEDAVKNGIQSTTRYRKPGPTKKGSSRMHAVQRQRSGARGGQAASRSVARSKKQGELSKFAKACSSSNDTSSTHQGIIDLEEYMLDQSPKYEYRPATPANGSTFQPLYKLPTMSDVFGHDHFLKGDQVEFLEHDVLFDQHFFEQYPSPNYDRMSKIGAD